MSSSTKSGCRRSIASRAAGTSSASPTHLDVGVRPPAACAVPAAPVGCRRRSTPATGRHGRSDCGISSRARTRSPCCVRLKRPGRVPRAPGGCAGSQADAVAGSPCGSRRPGFADFDQQAGRRRAVPTAPARHRPACRAIPCLTAFSTSSCSSIGGTLASRASGRCPAGPAGVLRSGTAFDRQVVVDDFQLFGQRHARAGCVPARGAGCWTAASPVRVRARCPR